MKTIRANVDLDGRVTLSFGWDKELVDFVKEVSGFTWVKSAHVWRGALHSLAALDFAAKKRGDTQIAVSWPTLVAPPVIVKSNFVLRDYQSQIVGVLLTRREFLLCWSPRVGKAQPSDAKVLTPTGWRQIGDLETGDLVISPGGGSVPVTGVFPQGVHDVYRVETSDGASTECCAEHLWTVQTHKLKGTTGNWVTRPLSWLIERGALASDGRHRWYLPLCKPPVFDFDRKRLGLEPYVLGALLGNGSFNDNGTVAFTCADAEVVARVRACLPLDDELRQRGRKTNEFGFSTQRPGRTTTARFVEDAGLRSKEAHEKFIPREFFLAAPEDRLALLNGLLDTDGDTPANSSTVVFNSASEQLCADVIELTRSLGGFASKRVKEEPHYTYKGETRTGRSSHRAYIRLEINPFSLSRKADKWRAGFMTRSVQSIESVGRKSVLCISIGSKDGLYVTDGYIVTHNTTAIIHAGATGIATRQVERVVVVPPANVTAEWSRQLGQAFPGMNFFELEGHPLETEKRSASFAKQVDGAVAKARAKRIASAEKKFLKAWAKQWKDSPVKPVPSEEQLQAVCPTEIELASREAEVRTRLGTKWGAAVEAERALVGRASTAHFVACQHDLVAPRSETLEGLAALGPFALCVDEIQLFTDEKAPRSKALIALAKHKNCRKVWCTSGTPMRNRPEDLIVFYELMGGVGSGKWGHLKRYANASEGAYGWETNGESNLDEAAARFASVSHRLTREQVKNDLPAIDRKVTLCPLSREEGLRYKALEAALGKKAMQGYGTDKTQALRTLVSSVLAVKLEVALARVLFHVRDRGQKVLVGANFHESLQAFSELIAARFPGAPFYVAGGWLGPDRRTAIVDQWKADPRPTPLLVNVLSSGVGIDLSDAEGTIILEIPWVPSDALQFEARILDVHLGKRTSPPWVEYLLAAGTVDEDMALANLKKIGVVDQVVGGERESRGLATALRDSGVVAQVDLGLVDKSDGAVEAALEGLRRRLSGQAPAATEGLSTAALVGAVEEAFDDEEEQQDERDAKLADAGG